MSSSPWAPARYPTTATSRAGPSVNWLSREFRAVAMLWAFDFCTGDISSRISIAWRNSPEPQVCEVAAA